MMVIGAAMVLLVAGCTHQPQMAIQPAAPVCDSMQISYAKDIQPIFGRHCYECHATAVSTTGGLDLQDTSSLKKYLLKGFRGDGIYGSLLYNCMLHSRYSQHMPPTYIVDTCSLRKIHHWLSAGAPVDK